MSTAPSPSIASLVAPLSADLFLEQHLGREWRHFTSPAGQRFDEALDWARLEDMLSSMRVDPRRVSLVKAGEVLAPERYLSSATGLGDRHVIGALVERELRDGATLMIAAVDEWLPWLGRLARDLEAWLHATVSANLYLAFCDTPGLHLHWDDHDTFIVQLAGRKRWTVYRPTLEHPIKELGPQPPRPSVAHLAWHGLLEPGARLYLPRGWWHLVEPVGELTAHATIGWNQPDGLGLIRGLLPSIARHTAARRSLPCHANDGELVAYLSALQRAIADSLQPEQVAVFLHERDCRRWTREPVALHMKAGAHR